MIPSLKCNWQQDDIISSVVVLIIVLMELVTESLLRTLCEANYREPVVQPYLSLKGLQFVYQVLSLTES